ncbi:uncharacterized protein FIBRA_06568 [Fibroporia radiculosa]|uniref:Uncharacterized protein n=1 Tax=Fibroporia radiculosa TaxID=599839 RepID=J4HZC1_9APHY|nr:uncharacterized protein FIBRA_06568 [Fibroporia radiculosa]CCM04392.1 predicted protein [Fibroporia radiculosa]
MSDFFKLISYRNIRRARGKKMRTESRVKAGRLRATLTRAVDAGMNVEPRCRRGGGVHLARNISPRVAGNVAEVGWAGQVQVQYTLVHPTPGTELSDAAEQIEFPRPAPDVPSERIDTEIHPSARASRANPAHAASGPFSGYPIIRPVQSAHGGSQRDRNLCRRRRRGPRTSERPATVSLLAARRLVECGGLTADGLIKAFDGEILQARLVSGAVSPQMHMQPPCDAGRFCGMEGKGCLIKDPSGIWTLAESVWSRRQGGPTV